MTISVFDFMDELSEAASEFIINELDNKPDLLFCAASGNSPSETYRKLSIKKDPVFYKSIKIIKLDEWGGVPMEDAGSCETYLQKHLIQTLKLSPEQYFSLDSNPADPLAECKRIQKIIDSQGPIDLCILGLGMNGHIAFNEPADFLEPHCHKVTLSDASKNHPMATKMKGKEIYGLSLGMADVLQSGKIILIITGSGKESIIKQFLSKKISTKLPASLLWLHPDTHCYIDKKACDEQILSLINNYSVKVS